MVGTEVAKRKGKVKELFDRITTFIEERKAKKEWFLIYLTLLLYFVFSNSVACTALIFIYLSQITVIDYIFGLKV